MMELIGKLLKEEDEDSKISSFDEEETRISESHQVKEFNIFHLFVPLNILKIKFTLKL